VKFRVIEGHECGKLSPAEAPTDETGTATASFAGAANVEDCKVTIEAASGSETGRASLFVNKLPLTKVRIDGISLLVLVLIASFAVDRIVRATLFLLGLFDFWRRRVPDPDEAPGDAAALRRHRIAYVLMAAPLALLALGWVGKVRILTALGFAQVDPWIDTLFTGLLVIGGADRTEAILQKFGAGGGGEAARTTTPLEITGRVILEESGKTGNPA
jgi:hypothetical protein